METCACGENKTFGQLLESYSDALTGEPLPAAFSMQLFDGLKNTSFCNLYSPSSQEGFSGACLVCTLISSRVFASLLSTMKWPFFKEHSLPTASSPFLLRSNEKMRWNAMRVPSHGFMDADDTSRRQAGCQ